MPYKGYSGRFISARHHPAQSGCSQGYAQPASVVIQHKHNPRTHDPAVTPLSMHLPCSWCQQACIRAACIPGCLESRQLPPSPHTCSVRHLHDAMLSDALYGSHLPCSSLRLACTCSCVRLACSCVRLACICVSREHHALTHPHPFTSPHPSHTSLPLPPTGSPSTGRNTKQQYSTTQRTAHTTPSQPNTSHRHSQSCTASAPRRRSARSAQAAAACRPDAGQPGSRAEGVPGAAGPAQQPAP